MANPAEEAAKTAGKGLTRKVGPLPVWGWAVVAVVSGGAVYFIFFRGSSAAPATNLAGSGPPPTTGGGGGGGVPTPGGPVDTTPPGAGAPVVIPGIGVVTGPGQTFTPTPATVVPPAAPAGPTVLTNPQWLNQAIPEVVRRLGLGADVVRLYLSQYLAGTGPVGNTQAVTAFQRVVDAAVQAVGQAPSAPTFNVNTNPFSSNATWFENARAFLGNVPGSVLLELQALFSGQTTTISQAAADALANARGVLGSEPTTIGYTVAGPPPLVSLDTVTQFLADATSSIKAGIDVNSPAVYQAIYRRWFPTLDAGQIEGLHQAVRNVYATNPTPSAELIRKTIEDAIRSGTRAPVPSGSPAPAAPAPSGGGSPAPPASGGGTTPLAQLLGPLTDGQYWARVGTVQGYVDAARDNFWSNGAWRALTQAEKRALGVPGN